MTTYTFKAVTTEYDANFQNAVDAGSGLVDFVVSDAIGDFSYEIIGALPTGQQEIAASLDPTAVNLIVPGVGSLLVDAVFASELDAGGESYVLLEYVGQIAGTNYVVTLLAEAPGTYFDSVASYQDFLDLGDGISNQGAITNPIYLPDQAINFDDFGWVSSSTKDDYTGFGTDDSFVGGAGADVIAGEGGADDLFGGAGKDSISGGDGEDELFGGAAGDTLDGGDDADSVFGGAGNDTLLGGGGDDLVSGDGGDDLIINLRGGSDTFDGGSGVDTLFTDVTALSPPEVIRVDLIAGTHGRDASNIGQDTLIGIENFHMAGAWATIAIGDGADNEFRTDTGNDTVFGGGGADTLITGNGSDTLDGGGGSDTLIAGKGADDLFGGAGNDTLNGGSGRDNLIGGKGNDDLTGGGGVDIIYGGSGADMMYGGRAGDTMGGGAGSDRIEGGAGNDTLSDGLGDDVLYGGAGNDVWMHGSGEDTFFGGAGKDIVIFDLTELDPQTFVVETNLETGDSGAVGNPALRDVLVDVEDVTLIGDFDINLTGNAASNRFVTDVGDDVLSGGRGDDVMASGGGDDSLFGQAGSDELNGGSGRDDLFGGSGEDTLKGGSAADNLFGGASADVLNGGTGNDMLTGGTGADIFEFITNAGTDVVTDFVDGTDQLDFSAFGLGGSADIIAAGNDVAGGYLIDLSLLGGAGSVFVENWSEAQINDADLILL